MEGLEQNIIVLESPNQSPDVVFNDPISKHIEMKN